METGSYRFQLGDFEYVALLDGSMDYEPGQFFANADAAQIEQVLREHGMPIDQIITPYTYLFVNTGDHRVLVDMGAGDLGDDTGKLVHNMRAAGIDPAEIDTVLITHAHGDHVGGSIDDQGQRNVSIGLVQLFSEFRVSFLAPGALPLAVG
jgi:glyoxylase-like metal-dependent hydrolase (beta-lactamase superfamily II)